MEDGQDAQLSRPTQIGPFGTMTAELKTAIDQDTLEAFDKKARAAGVTRSDVLRNLAYIFVHGKSFDVLMAEAADRRMRLLLGEGLELAREIQQLAVRGDVNAADVRRGPRAA
jgi:hypothetical protein